MMRAIAWALLGLIVLAAAAFFLVAPGLFEAATNKVAAPEGGWPAPSPRAQALHKTLLVADLHADTLLWKRSVLARAGRGHVDAPRLLEGGATLQVFSAVTKSPSGLNYESNTAKTDDLILLSFAQLQPPQTWGSPHARALHQAQKLASADRRSKRLMIVRSRADLADLLKRRKEGEAVVGGLLALEGLHPIEGDLAKLDALWMAGYRMGGLQHFFDNEIGGSLHGVSDAGLTALGKQAIAKMNADGWIVDVAHSSPAVVTETLALSSRPIVVSHTGFKGHCDKKRNIPDALMKAIAAKGGLIGVGFWDEAACATTPAAIAQAIAYGVKLVGEDHVALGSDFDGAITAPFDASQLALITEALLDQGLSEAQIAKIMGANTIALLEAQLPET